MKALRLIKRLVPVVLAASLMGLVGCATTPAPVVPAFEPPVDGPLPDGEYGLFKLDPSAYPDMTKVLDDRANLEAALTKSIEYMEAQSSHHFFQPKDPISHDQVYAGLLRVREMIRTNVPSSQIQSEIVQKFEVWSSRGYDWNTRPPQQPGKVWFTAYFTPIYFASKVPTSEYKYPLYGRPADLVSDPNTGDVMGQKMPDGSLKPGYPSRGELTANGAAKLKGLELMYFKDPIEPYIIQVQGSAQVVLTDGTSHMLGYAGSNGGEYLGLGTQLKEKGILAPKEVSLPNVLKFFHEHPEELDTYVNNSKRFVFMKEYTTAEEKAEWPKGSIGRHVTPMRSLATDKKIFPRAAITFADVTMPTGEAGRIMLDQDTGGAIRAAGRADIYVGIGPQAGLLAGKQYSEGHLYYIVSRPSEAPAIIARLGKKPKAVVAPIPAPPRTGVTRVAPGTPAKSGTKPPATGGGDEMFPK